MWQLVTVANGVAEYGEVLTKEQLKANPGNIVEMLGSMETLLALLPFPNYFGTRLLVQGRRKEF